MGQENGVAQPMGQIVYAAQSFRYAMHRCHIRMAEGNARQHTAHKHGFPCMDILPVPYGSLKVIVDKLDGIQSHRVAEGLGAVCRICLYGVGKGVHAGGGGYAWRYGYSKLRVAKCHLCGDKWAFHRHLIMVGGVGDHRGKGQLAACAGGGGHGKQGRYRLFYPGLSLIGLYLIRIVGEQHPYGLAAVYGAASSHGYYGIRAELPGCHGARFHIVVLGIGLYFVKYTIGHPCGVKACSHLIRYTGGPDALIRHHQRAADPLILQHLRQLCKAARSVFYFSGQDKAEWCAEILVVFHNDKLPCG